MKHFFLTFLLLHCLLPAFSQERDEKPIDFYITVNTNLYLPGKSSDKAMFPILGYDKGTDPKFLVGGFGIGLVALKWYTEKVSFKGQVNLNRVSYWNEPMLMRDVNGDPFFPYYYSSTDIAIGLNVTIQYSLAKNLRVGIGIGTQVLLYSYSRAPFIPNSDDSKHYSDSFYKTIMPTIPIEISYKLKRTLFTFRYEQALFNRYKSDLKDYQSENYGLLFFEIGYSL